MTPSRPQYMLHTRWDGISSTPTLSTPARARLRAILFHRPSSAGAISRRGRGSRSEKAFAKICEQDDISRPTTSRPWFDPIRRAYGRYAAKSRWRQVNQLFSLSGGALPTQKRMAEWYPERHSRECPLCGDYDIDEHRVIKCSAAAEVRRQHPRQASFRASSIGNEFTEMGHSGPGHPAPSPGEEVIAASMLVVTR